MSPFGTSRHFAAAQQSGSIWSEADINHRAGFMSTRPSTTLADFLLLTSVMGFPNQFFNDSWVVGMWRAVHGGNNVGLGRRAWALARAVPRALGSQVTAANVSTLRGGADRTG